MLFSTTLSLCLVFRGRSSHREREEKERRRLLVLRLKILQATFRFSLATFAREEGRREVLRGKKNAVKRTSHCLRCKNVVVGRRCIIFMRRRHRVCFLSTPRNSGAKEKKGLRRSSMQNEKKFESTGEFLKFYKSTRQARRST